MSCIEPRHIPATIITASMITLSLIAYTAITIYVSAALLRFSPSVENTWYGNIVRTQASLLSAPYPMIAFLLLMMTYLILPSSLVVVSRRHQRLENAAPTPVHRRVDQSILLAVFGNSRISIFLIAVVGALVVSYPYWYLNNALGLDLGYYYNRAMDLRNGIVDIHDPRIISVFLVSLWSLVSTSPLVVALLHTSFLTFATAASVYLLFKEGTGDQELAMIAAFFSTVSYHIIIGIMTAIYSSWLSIIFLNVFLALLLKYERTERLFLIPILFAASFLIFFEHPWTWLVMVGIIMIFTILKLVETKNSSKQILVLRYLKLLGVSIVPALVAAVSLAFTTAYLQRVWYDLGRIISFDYLRFFANAPMLGLFLDSRALPIRTMSLLLAIAVVGSISASLGRSNFARILSAWILFLSVLVPFTFPWELWRLYYLFPVEAIAALGLQSLLTPAQYLCAPIHPHGGKLFTLLVSGWMILYALATMAALIGIADL